MTNMRPECSTARKDTPTLRGSTALYRVMQAVSRQRVLIHGRLHDNRGHHCAIGAVFDDGVQALESDFIDEIAAYNDSFPKLTGRERRNKVLAWLRFRVKLLQAKKP